MGKGKRIEMEKEREDPPQNTRRVILSQKVLTFTFK